LIDLDQWVDPFPPGLFFGHPNVTSNLGEFASHLPVQTYHSFPPAATLRVLSTTQMVCFRFVAWREAGNNAVITLRGIITGRGQAQVFLANKPY